jgi:putative PEP-CTERM system TPR-repeat lipoprotein
MKLRAAPFPVIALMFGAAFLVQGCGSKDAASYVQSAKSYLAKSDYKAAIIEVKNALQKEPGNGEARLLLGEALLESGDPVGAETELRKAIDGGASIDRVDPLLARTLIAQGQFAKVVNEFGGTKLGDQNARIALAIELAVADAGAGNTAKARSGVDAILKEQPNNLRALLLQAQLSASTGDIAGTRSSLDAALKVSPKSAEALLMKAELELADRHRDEAQKLMESAIDANPNSIAARSALVSLAATSGKLDIAKAQVEKMKGLQPQDFRTVYADALVAFAEGDNARARQSLQRLLAARPDNMQSLLLSGLVDLRLQSYASAEAALRRVLARAPANLVSIRALALVYLRTGRAKQSLETLAPAISEFPDDPTLLRIAGEAYLADGNAAKAAESYERANNIDKTNVPSRVRLAQVRFAAGDTARAFSDLEAMSTNEATIGQADLALFAAHLSRREYDKALAMADKLEKKAPKSAVPWNLRGTAYLAQRDLAKARSSFEKALELQPDFYSAAANLAAIDIQEGNLKAARDRYDKLLAKNPKNEQLLLGSAELMQMSGAPGEQVRAAYDKAVSANPTSVRARLASINYEVTRRDPKAALAIAQAANAAIPNDPRLTQALAKVQLLNGNPNQAVDTLKQFALHEPQNPASWLSLAEAQIAAKDYGAAIESARKALALKPDAGPAWATITKVYMAEGRPDQALEEARKLQKQHKDIALGYALEGEILAATKKWPEAAAAFRVALSKQPTSALAVRLYVMLHAAGKPDDANAMAVNWMKAHPKDSALLQLMAQVSQQRKNFTAAADGYRRVLEVDPDNVAALNNLAWVMIEQNDPNAVEYAERAHRLAPFSPNVLDTLGWARTRTGDPKRGVVLLRMAATLAPGSDEIRLHLAKALLDSGDKSGARTVLTELTKLDAKSPIRAEAEKLLATP